jgi:hypothetical protein
VKQYNSIESQLLLSYEDEDEKWHKIDAQPSELTPSLMTATNFEGTMENKTIKYRIVAFAIEGEGAVRKFGDESDYDAEDGKGFPAIPPALSASRLPKLVSDTQVSLSIVPIPFALHICTVHNSKKALRFCATKIQGVETMASPGSDLSSTNGRASFAIALRRSKQDSSPFRLCRPPCASRLRCYDGNCLFGKCLRSWELDLFQ